LEPFIDTIASILASILRAIGLRRPGRRREIRANLELLDALGDRPEFADARNVLVAHTNLEIFRFVGVPIPGSRKPIQWGSVAGGLVLGGPAAYGVFALDSGGFNGWSVPLGVWAGFCLLGGPVGQIFFRERIQPVEMQEADAQSLSHVTEGHS